MDYVEVLNQPIDANIGVPFIINVEVLLVEYADTFDLKFEILGKGLYFLNHSEPVDFLSRITKEFNYEPTRHLQRCQAKLTIGGEFFHFPIRTVIRVSTFNSRFSDCKINLYDTFA